jgi:hypothetical protein
MLRSLSKINYQRAHVLPKHSYNPFLLAMLPLILSIALPI